MIFEADTPAGKAFDVALLVAIVLSILAVMLESVDQYDARYGPQLRFMEWVFTACFSVEYLLRVASVERPWRYIFGFRILKLVHFVNEAAVLRHALAASRRKITVFLGSVVSLTLIMGYSIIAVPTGIVSAELAQASRQAVSTQACPSCSQDGHDVDANHCKFCGTKL